MSFHVTYHGQIKPGGAQPSPSLVWVRSFLLLDELLDDLPEPVIPQVTRSLKRTWPAVGKTLYSYRPPGGLPMGLGLAARGVAHICRCIELDIRELLMSF